MASSTNTNNSTTKINEKELTHKSAPFALSNTLHASFGIDHYPNYLYRWSMTDINELEQQLTAQLKHVQSKKHEMQQIFAVTKSFKGPLHCSETPPTTEFLRTILHESLVPLIECDKDNNCSLKWNFNTLQQIMAEETDNVYSFPLLNAAFCDKLMQHVTQYQTFIDTVQKINATEVKEPGFSAKRSVLDWMGLAWLNDWLLRHVVNPIAAHLYQHEMHYNCSADQEMAMTKNMRKLDWRHGYVIGYKSKQALEADLAHEEQKKEEKGKMAGQLYQRSGLVVHTDDSEITLNCCLRDAFEGGTLDIWSERGKEYLDARYKNKCELETQIKLKKGYAVIHRGRQFHSVSDITSGQRAVLILWCRSVKQVRREICPCCWLNRRNDLNCICGAAWN